MVPHWNAETQIENTAQSAMKQASARPRLRCSFEAVSIMRSEMMDNLANPSVAIYSMLFAYSAYYSISMRLRKVSSLLLSDMPQSDLWSATRCLSQDHFPSGY